MAESLENYIPQPIATKFRRQAWKVWLGALAVVSVWALLIVAAPLSKAAGASSIAEPLYRFFQFICHQIPERSFHMSGEPLGVCSRCSGVYFGLVIGFAAYPLWRNVADVEPPARFWLFLSMVPIVFDWSLTIFGIWDNTQFTRVITGLILGGACATFIFPAIVDAVRNLTSIGRRRDLPTGSSKT